jgi:hypothetical protein
VAEFLFSEVPDDFLVRAYIRGGVQGREGGRDDRSCPGIDGGKRAMTKHEKLKDCAGCSEDFYNGHNPYGIEECWHLEDAKLVRKKKVAMDQRPPWTQPAQRVLNCYRQKGYVFVGPEQER